MEISVSHKKGILTHALTHFGEIHRNVMFLSYVFLTYVPQFLHFFSQLVDSIECIIVFKYIRFIKSYR